MSSASVELHFSGSDSVQLFETWFRADRTSKPLLCVRGKTAGAIKDAGTFQWTSAVRAISILFVKSILSSRDSTNKEVGYLSGIQGSLAASLDFALSKQPQWLRDMFGVDENGNAVARTLILRTNPERKRPGPVIVGINDQALAATNIHLYCNGTHIDSTKEIRKLLKGLQHDSDPALPGGSPSSTISKIAA